MNTEHFEKLSNMYLSSKVNTQIFDTTECNIEHKKATITLTVAEKYFHALGAIHGSVYFKLLDDAAFFAVNSIVEDVFILTTSFTTNIVRPVSTGKITAIGKVRFVSRNLFIAESSMINEAGKEIAFGTGHFAKSKITLSEEIGYKL
ncbi:PaaI family thioesterase [Reichenbachiella sp.]|uniref:PaaI family thioesterase n=1 Tax=Reichenbachiella sp. TaxID=2184521 RepID=UPI003B5B17C7